MEKVTIKYRGVAVDCYGKLCEESAIIVGGCQFEEVIDNYNYETGYPFSNWRETVKYLIDIDGYAGIQQLEVD